MLTLSVVPPTSYSITDSFCTGSTYNFNGRQLNVAGQYLDTLVSANGCVSFVTLTLGIDSLPVVNWNSSSDTLNATNSAVALNGATPVGGYYTGAGVSGNYFYPDSAGAGTHLVTYTYTDSLGCANSASKAFVVVVAGIKEIQLASSFVLYPNPANDKLVLQSDLFASNQIIPAIYDITGKIVPVSFHRETNSITFDIAGIAAGMYWVKFSVNGTMVSKKFVKAD